MKKRILILMLLFLFLLGTLEAYSFQDSLGRTVTVDHPKKVACLLSSYADLWNLSGGTVSITVGESEERGYVSSGTTLVDKASGMSINSELLLASRPDFVILSATLSSHRKLETLLTKAGIPAAYFNLDSFGDFLTLLKVCTEINGRDDLYELYGKRQEVEVKALIEKAKAQKEKARILFIRAGAGLSSTKVKSSDSHFATAIIKDLGAVNVGDNAKLKDNLSLEAIVEENPDTIFIVTQGNEKASAAYMEDLFKSSGWKSLKAVREGSYLFLDRELFHFKPNARWSEAYRVMYRLLYGEIQ